MLKKLISHQALCRRTGFVNGEWVSAASGAAFPVFCPATRQPIGEVSNFGTADANDAIGAADVAFTAFQSVSAKNRAEMLTRWAALIRAHRQDLALIMTQESGKPIAEALGEIEYAALFVDWYAGEAERIYGDVLTVPRPGVRAMARREPLGVVGVITPWNFPSAMVTRCVAGAVAAGCTVVLKPSELTPFSSIALAELASEAQVPAGVLNVVPGEASAIGAAMMESSVVRKLSFTGSTRTGKLLLEQAARTVKRTSMELGGNAPLIVFEDADIDAAVRGVIAAKFRNAGQTCISVNRVYVQEAVHDQFVKKLTAAVSRLRQGHGRAVGVTLGPLISPAAVEGVRRLVDEAVASGAHVENADRVANVLMDIEAPGEHKVSPRGFYPPTVLTGVTDDMPVVQQEIFGPVVPVMKFSTSTGDQDVIARANAVKVGLAAYVFTESARRQWRVPEQLAFGMVGVNDTALSAPAAPFGGVKESGMGRDGGPHGIEEFLNTKYTLIGGIQS